MAPKNLRVGLKARWLDHLTPKLPNNIQHLVEMVVDSLYGPSKTLVDHPKPLVVSNYMEEH